MFFWQFSPAFWRENCVPRLLRSHHLNFCHVSYSVFRIAQSLFLWELIFCMFCYSYSGIRIDGIVPKERVLNICTIKLHFGLHVTSEHVVCCGACWDIVWYVHGLSYKFVEDLVEVLALHVEQTSNRSMLIFALM